MNKSLFLLLFAVLAPGVVLGWLSLQSAKEQEIVLEKQTAELCQKETEGVAANARAIVEEERRSFNDAVQLLLSGEDAERLASHFTEALTRTWNRRAIGFAVTQDGRLLSPAARQAATKPEYEQFLWENGAFIGNKIFATVYPVQIPEATRPDAGELQQTQAVQSPVYTKGAKAVYTKGAFQSAEVTANDAQQMQRPFKLRQSADSSDSDNGLLVMKDAPQTGEVSQALRNVTPMRQQWASQLQCTTGNFCQLTGAAGEGVINRFVQDRLEMIFWVRAQHSPGYLFGCLVHADDFQELWASALPGGERASSGRFPQAARPASESFPDFVIALLDDKAKPVAVFPAGATVADWKHPFVASEIGEALPHWEATLHLAHPEQLAVSASRIRRTLCILIGCSLAAIVIGGGLVIADTRRQLALAQQKSDFVSNVSHELKTPLTSVRMFAELLHDGRAEPARQAQYLRIIMVEAERLTRLINNVLDFARIERREKRLEMREVDLYRVIERVWESVELRLRDSGFHVTWDADESPYLIAGDEDALAQVLVNLLSNAEKYAGDNKEITLTSRKEGSSICVSVLDRGIGVPRGEEQKIFQAFYRAHDSLSSGIQGAGLGLTLAHKLIAEHCGSISYSPRSGGGSIFAMRIPMRSLEAAR